MRCLVFVEFARGGSIPPTEFFMRMKAIWSYVKETESGEKETGSPSRNTSTQSAKCGICIADYDSIEQLTTDLAIMPGAGISNVQVFPFSEETDIERISADMVFDKA